MKAYTVKDNRQDIEDMLIIHNCLIEPLQKIVVCLESKDYRDCDVKWLNEQLVKYINFAAETFNLKVNFGKMSNAPTILNDYAYEFYTIRFNTLLNYFTKYA